MPLVLPCQGDPELYFSDVPQDIADAKSRCTACVIRAQCLSGARERREPWGVWGGQLFIAGTIVQTKPQRGRPGPSAEDDLVAAKRLLEVINAKARPSRYVRAADRDWTAARSTIDEAFVTLGHTPLASATFTRALGLLVRSGSLQVRPGRPRTYIVTASDPSDAQAAASF